MVNTFPREYKSKWEKTQVYGPNKEVVRYIEDNIQLYAKIS